MATQYTYDSGGTGDITRHEDLQDLIAIMSPTDTPLWSLLQTRIPTSTLYEWLVDEIVQAVGAENAALEGAPVTPTNRTRFRLQNQVMINSLGIDISDTQRHMDEAGIDDEYSWQITQKGLELMKQMERNLWFSQWATGAQTGPTTGTARQTIGVADWTFGTGISRNDGVTWGLAPNTNLDCAKYGAAVYENRTALPMTEANFNDLVLKPSWENGNDINACIMFVGGSVKRLISGYGTVYDSTGATNTTSLTRMNVDAEKALRAIAVDWYMSDFGTFAIALNRYMVGGETPTISTPNATPTSTKIAGDDILIGMDPSFLRINTLRPLQYSPLAKTKDSAEAYVVGEYGLQVDNPVALFGADGVITGAVAPP